MPFTLAHLKTLLALSALMAAFGAGFKASASHHEIERLQNIEESYKAKEESLKRAYSRIESLLNSQAALSVKTKIIIKEVPIYVSDQMDQDCTTHPDVVSLLNAARDSRMSIAPTVPAKENPRTSSVGYRELIEANIDTAGRYNAALLQCNTLIEWVKNNHKQ